MYIFLCLFSAACLWRVEAKNSVLGARRLGSLDWLPNVSYFGQRACPSELHGLRWVETPTRACTTITRAFGSWNSSLDGAPLRQYCTQPVWWLGALADVAVVHSWDEAQGLASQLPLGGRAWVSLNVSGSPGPLSWSWPVRDGSVSTSTYGLADPSAWQGGLVPPPVDGQCAVLTAAGLLEALPCSNRSFVPSIACAIPPCQCSGPPTAANCTTAVYTARGTAKALVGLSCAPLLQAPAITSFHVWRNERDWVYDEDRRFEKSVTVLASDSDSARKAIGCGQRIDSAAQYDRLLNKLRWNRGDGLLLFGSLASRSRAMLAYLSTSNSLPLMTQTAQASTTDEASQWACPVGEYRWMLNLYPGDDVAETIIHFARPRTIAAYKYGICVLLRQPRGSVRCWGGGALYYTGEQLLVPADLPPVSSLALNGYATCVLYDGNTIGGPGTRCWGDRAAALMPGSWDATNLYPFALIAGERSMCALINGDFSLVCWSTGKSVVRTPVTRELGPVAALADGIDPACAVQARTLAITCWDKGAVGTTPADLPPVHALTGSESTLCAHLLGSGAVRCWSKESLDPFPNATALSLTAPVAALAVRQGSMCVILAGTGAPRCFTGEKFDNFGDLVSLCMEWPDPGPLPPLAAVDISCDGRCACGVSAANGSMHCWGELDRRLPDFEAPLYTGDDPRDVPFDVQAAGVLHPSDPIHATFRRRSLLDEDEDYMEPLPLTMAHPLQVTALAWTVPHRPCDAASPSCLDLTVVRASAPDDAASAHFALVAASTALAWPEIAIWTQAGPEAAPKQVFCQETLFFSDYMLKCLSESPMYGARVRWWTGMRFNESTSRRPPGSPALHRAWATPSAYAASVSMPVPNVDIANVAAQMGSSVPVLASQLLAVRPGDEVILEGSAFGLHAAKLQGEVPWWTAGPGLLRSCVHLAWWASPASYHNDSACVCNGLEDWLGEGELPLSAITAWNDTLIRFRAPMGEGIREVRLCVEGRGMNSSSYAPRSFSSLYLVWEPPALVDMLPGKDFGYTDRDTQVAAVLSVTAPGYGTLGLTWGQCANGSSLTDLSAPVPGRVGYSPPLPVDRASEGTRHCTTAVVMQDSLGRCSTTAMSTVPAALAACRQSLLPAILTPGQTALLPYSSLLPEAVFDQGMLALPLDEPVPNAVLNMTYSVYAWDAGVRIAGSRSHSTLEVRRTPAVLRSVSPNPLLLGPGEQGALLTLTGAGIRTLEEVADPRNGLVGRLSSPNVSVTVDGVPCTGVKVYRTREAPLGHVTCMYPAQELPGGLHMVRMTMAGTDTALDSSDGLTAGLYTACAAGFYGLFAVPGHQTCLPCPRGAACAEGIGLPPIAQEGFYNLGLPARRNASSLGDPERRSVLGVSALGPHVGSVSCPVEGDGRPLACVVPCDPQDSCLGDNVCAEGYASTAPVYRCASCAVGYYRSSSVCSKCPAVGSLTILLLLLAAMGAMLLLYVLSKNDIRLGSVDLVLEYAQVLSLLQGPALPWPAAVHTCLNSLSLLRVNIEVTAPECYSAISLTPELKLWMVLVLPLVLVSASAAWYWGWAWCKGWLLGSADAVWSHGPSVCRTTLKLLGALYLPVVQSSLQVWNCTPTEPSDGKEYLAIAFEPCWTSEGLQARMIPWAQAGLVLYGALYPTLLALFLYHNGARITEDQLLLAAGTGYDARTNPRAHVLRQYFSPLYVDYQPGKHWFALVKHARCALVCICALMLNKSPVLLAASVAFVILIAMFIQTALSPLMTPQTGHLHALYLLSLSLRQGTGSSGPGKGLHGPGQHREGQGQGEWAQYWRARVQELAALTGAQRLHALAAGDVIDEAALPGVFPRMWWARNVLDWNLLESQLKGQVVLTALLSIMYNAGREGVYAARAVPAVTAMFFCLQALAWSHIGVTVGWEIVQQAYAAMRGWLGQGQGEEPAQDEEGDAFALYGDGGEGAGACRATCLVLYLCCFRCCVNRRLARALLLALHRRPPAPGRGYPRPAHTGGKEEEAALPVSVSEWTRNPLEKQPEVAKPDSRRAHAVAMLHGR